MTSETIYSINPATEEVTGCFELHSREQIEEALEQASLAFDRWRKTSFPERALLMQNAARCLRTHEDRHARIITTEMGKPLVESRAEVEKCAWNCEYYAENGERFLRK